MRPASESTSARSSRAPYWRRTASVGARISERLATRSRPRRTRPSGEHLRPDAAPEGLRVDVVLGREPRDACSSGSRPRRSDRARNSVCAEQPGERRQEVLLADRGQQVVARAQLALGGDAGRPRASRRARPPAPRERPDRRARAPRAARDRGRRARAPRSKEPCMASRLARSASRMPSECRSPETSLDDLLAALHRLARPASGRRRPPPRTRSRPRVCCLDVARGPRVLDRERRRVRGQARSGTPSRASRRAGASPSPVPRRRRPAGRPPSPPRSSPRPRRASSPRRRPVGARAAARATRALRRAGAPAPRRARSPRRAPPRPPANRPIWRSASP